MLRGGFGINLKRQCCRKAEMCKRECEQPDKCVYGAIFETPLTDISILGKVEKAPRQFSLFPITQGLFLLEPDEELSFLWTIWGKTHDYFPYCVLAWAAFGRSGIGINRSPAVLLKIEDTFSGEIVYSDEDRRIIEPTLREFNIEKDNTASSVKIETLSPLRLKHKNRLLGKNEPKEFVLPAEVLFFHLLRRIQTLFNSVDDKIIPSLYELLDEVKECSSSFRWQEIRRYSHRQKQSLQMGGVMGKIVWKSLPSIWVQLLKIGEYIQIGKGTTMGMGKYKTITEEK